jgi:beta-lactamase regulating signal transducer with metallopeptidase domain
MTCGVITPVIVMPAEARQWDEADLRRAIVHELEHVRRGDWASHCIARVACALYWFHPLVWIAQRSLSLEAERACDDAVLGRTEATAYADQLIVLAERLSAASHPPVLAMASRHDLTARVTAVLDSTQARGRAGRRWLAAAGAASALLVTAMAPIRLVAVARTSAQDAAGARERFSAVSMKPCAPESVPPGAGGRGLPRPIIRIAIEARISRFVDHADDALAFHRFEVDPHQIVMR